MPALETAAATANLKLEQNRLIRAPRARVYEAWTDPEMMRLWFGAPSMVCASASLDVRVGGRYRIEAVRESATAAGDDPCEGRATSTVVGEYTKVVPNELLQFTWTAAWAPEEQSLVTVSLKEVADGTELTIVHEKFLSEASRDAHNAGWTYALNQIQRVTTA